MKHQKLGKLTKEYDKLSDEQKIERLEFVLQYYVDYATKGGDFIVEVTEKWPVFEAMRDYPAEVED